MGLRRGRDGGHLEGHRRLRLWYLAEYEDGAFKLNRNPREFASVEAYLRRQGRFKALTDEDIAQVEAARDAKWEVMRRDWA